MTDGRQHVDVCVLGGGPAGSAFAMRLARLGHRVALVERAPFPRPHIGESLTPGVWLFLERLGIAGRVADAGFTPCRRTMVLWSANEPEERRHDAAPGLLVDRPPFDALLLDAAREAGVLVLQPATLVGRQATAHGWRLRIAGAGPAEIDAAILADATGRTGALRGARQPSGQPTLALYGYWCGRGVPPEPRIEALDSGWAWGVPLPDGRYNTMAFVDADRLKGRAAGAAELLRGLLGRSRLFSGLARGAELGPVRGADATAWRELEPVSPDLIKIGEAAIGIDPLSSSGVEKALQSAFDAALVVNTRLRRPGDGATAMRFYRDELAAAAERHARWAAGFYATAIHRDHAFWRRRAVVPLPPVDVTPADVTPTLQMHGILDRPLFLSPSLAIEDVPCVVGDFLTPQRAVRHPALDRPVAFLGGRPLPPLLDSFEPGTTAWELAQRWSSWIPPEAGLTAIGWLLGQGLLVPAGDEARHHRLDSGDERWRGDRANR